MNVADQAMLFMAMFMLIMGMLLGAGSIRSYYRSKIRYLGDDMDRAIVALAKIQKRHESYCDGMGPCMCDSHIEARLVIKLYHERGGR